MKVWKPPSLLVFLASLLLFEAPLLALSSNERDLNTLEVKLFGRSYISEPADSRLKRLENLVFGSQGSGHSGERIQILMSATGTPTTEATSAQSVPLPSSAGPESSVEPTLAGTAPIVPLFTNGRALEGANSSSTSDSLLQNLPPTQGQQPLMESKSGRGSVDSFPSEVSGSSSAPANEVDQYPRIGFLEESLLGQSFSSDDPSNRLSRLEKSAFGKTSEELALSDRTDLLQGYVEKKTQRRLFPSKEDVGKDSSSPSVVADGEQPTGKSSSVPKFLGMLGSALLGAPLGGAGMGMPGLAGTGFGGIRVRPKEVDASDEKDPVPSSGMEDPVIFRSSPPPPGSKMMITVGWCEMQLFGKTSSELHLPQRLVQLSEALQFKQGSSGIDLMDEIPAMVDAVVAKKGQPIANQSATHGQDATVH